MLAVSLHRYGGPEVLQTEEVDIPRPGPGQVLLAVEAVAVGFAQTQMRRNEFPGPLWHPTFPVVLGGDVIGVVEKTGPGAGSFHEGDRVGGYLMHGAYAEWAVANTESLIPIPGQLDAAEATILAGAGQIAAGVMATGGFRPGMSVLVHAASGATGHLAVQFAKVAGAGQIIATASAADKREFARSLGADVVVDYTRPGWAEQIRRATGGRGVDLILDSIGGDVLLQGVDLLAPAGHLVFYGSAGGGAVIPQVSVLDLVALKSVSGFSLTAWRTARPSEHLDTVSDLTRWLCSGQVHTSVFARLPLSAAAAAHRLVEQRLHRGRVVLLPELDRR
ncbi:zinc-binding alcohol dehydrogenase family protein [Nocardia sp. NBC_01388]|uniref:quinone oxidoreductase family protein n=1 Tax=Nocardia sp. NBC_01388 TaxID=2903596 RepID=UPI0032523A40